jgi:OFA family oxalate/formate antiporter-like MFS transporter
MSPVVKGWVVTFAGFGINLTLGVLYTWNVTASVLTRPLAAGGLHGWTSQQAFWPYAFALGCFSLAMVAAGRLQDRIGPRWVATAGGALVGIGMIVASLSPARLAGPGAFPIIMVAGFGVLTGTGIGFAYAAATPAAAKWFSLRRRGLAIGIVISGFGFSALYSAPLSSLLLRVFGVDESFLILGGIFFFVVTGLAQLLADPPKGYVPPGSYDERPQPDGPAPIVHEYPPAEMVATPSFAMLWCAFACSTCAGLSVLTALPRIATLQLGLTAGLAVAPAIIAVAALGNGAGRLLAGVFSDRTGRPLALMVAFALQGVFILALRFASTPPLLLPAALLVALAYGANLALMPAATFDFFGTRHAGADYGLVFTAWGVGGVLGTQVEALLFERGLGPIPAPAHSLAFTTALGLCALATLLAYLLRPPSANSLARDQMGVTDFSEA